MYVNRKDLRRNQRYQSPPKAENSKKQGSAVYLTENNKTTESEDLLKPQPTGHNSHRNIKIETKDFIRLPEKDQLILDNCKTEEKSPIQIKTGERKTGLLEKRKKERIAMQGFTIFQPSLPQHLRQNSSEREVFDSAPVSSREPVGGFKKIKSNQMRSKSTVYKGKKIPRTQLCK